MSPEEFSDFVKTANQDVARPMCVGSLQPPLKRRAAKHSRSHVADLHPHGICATCGQDYPVLVDGTLASHPAGIPWPDVDHRYLRAERTDRRQLKMAAPITGLSTFRRERGAHVDDAATAEAFVEFGAARMHFETTDKWPSLSGCREWRATVRVSALDGHRDDIADIEVAAAQFLVLHGMRRAHLPHRVPYVCGPGGSGWVEGAGRMTNCSTAAVAQPATNTQRTFRCLIQVQIIAAMTGTNRRAVWCWLRKTTGTSRMLMASDHRSQVGTLSAITPRRVI